MADKASGSINASILSDIAKMALGSTISYEPADATEKWIYTEVILDAASTALLQAGIQYLDHVRGDGTETATATGDKPKWLLIKNTGTTDGSTATTDGIVISVHASANAAYDEVEGIYIGSGETWIGKFPATTLNTIGGCSVAVTNDSPSGSGTGDVLCIVAGIIDDVA